MATTRVYGFVMAVLTITALASPTVRAQHGQDAGIVGTVRDRTGAVLVETSVTITSPQLITVSQTERTDSTGTYRFSYLPPGSYEVVVERAGFKTAVRSGVRLVPGLTFTVDFVLEVATATETVHVNAPSPAVDVRSSASPTLINRTLLENLPLIRTVTDLINLAPGVVQNVAMGGTLFAHNFSVDGASGNEPGWNGPFATPNLSWFDELQIVTVGANAQYGEFTGARLNAITRSGSNDFSGLAQFWTTRPNWTGNNRGSLTAQQREQFRPIEILQRWDSSAQVGGPLLRDRLWFFSGAAFFRDKYRPVTFAGVPRTPGEPNRSALEQKYITKLTATWSPAIRAEGFYAYDSNDASGSNAGPLVRPEALDVSDWDETMWNARLLWTIGARTFLELRHGGTSVSTYYGPPEERRLGPPGHFDTATRIWSVNFSDHSDVSYRPVTTSGHVSLTWPRHEVQSGFEHEHSRLRTTWGYVGGQWYLDANGHPDIVYLMADDLTRATQNRYTWYVQDGWRVADRLTLNLGLRAGLYDGGVPTYSSAFTARSLSPRIGIAWDPAGDHRTVVRGHYGRYHDAFVTSFYDFLDPLSRPWTIVAQVTGPGEFSELTRFGSTLNAAIGPGINFPFAEEYLAGLERELPWGVVATARFVRRDFKDAIGFIDIGSQWQPVQRTDPGPDGGIGTADDGGAVTVFVNPTPSDALLRLTNPPSAYRRYSAVQLVATKRYARDLQFQASYTWSRTVGNYDNRFTSNAANADLGPTGSFVNPNKLINAHGRTPQDFTHEVKVLGTYRVEPWGGLNVSGVYRYQSGRPWARSVNFGAQMQTFGVFVEPRGTRQLPAVNVLDVRVEKTWTPSRQIGTLGVFADVFNLTNQGIALRINGGSGPNFGVPTQWIEPRMLRVGARVSF